jgi:glycerophosphoryl diester phosphodiesterase
MRRKRSIAVGVLLLIAAAVYFGNASWRASPPANADVRIIAHRGMHQTYDRTGIERDTCTADRIRSPQHPYLENTVASMKAAFEAGADIVELDVHPTTDGQLAVFHDWTLDCRTNGTGETRGHDMAHLKSLDIGYGYTPDGQTYPFRGKGIGLMPELKEVLAVLPGQQFLINFKSRETREGGMLADLVGTRPEWKDAVWGAYGGDEPTRAAKKLMPDLNTWTRSGIKNCLLRYFSTGWLGRVPRSCRDTQVMVPVNVAPFMWGWPQLFIARMRSVGSEVILVGPVAMGNFGVAGIDTREDYARVPKDFDGYIWTNRVEVIAPLAGQIERTSANLTQ